MPRAAIQLYTLRALDESLPSLLETVAAAGYDGVEFAYGVADADLDAVEHALDRNGLAAASAHVPMEAFEEERDAVLDRADRLGVETLVVPWLDPEAFASEASVADAAARLNALADDLAGEGLSLAYHNHDHEFVALGDGTAMGALLAETDARVGFEPDLGWAAVGGADPVALLDRYGDRITHVHFADARVDEARSVALGDGDLDLPACAAAARRTETDWWIYEHDDPDDPLASAERGGAVLTSLLE